MTVCSTVGITKTRLAAIDNYYTGAHVITKTNLAIGSTSVDVAYDAFDCTVSGVQYSFPADPSGAAPGTDTIQRETWGCVAIEIDASGTTSSVSAPKNEAGYATEALAIADLPATTSDKCRLGYVTVFDTTNPFTFGTTFFTAAFLTANFYDSLTGGQIVLNTP